MNTMTYKGYTAAVEFDGEAAILYGRVLHLRDTIDFRADNVEQLKQEFAASVDDYLGWCAESGEAPEKPFSGKFVVRLDPAEHRAAAIAAATENLSLNEWVKTALGEAVAAKSKANESKRKPHNTSCYPEPN